MGLRVLNAEKASDGMAGMLTDGKGTWVGCGAACTYQTYGLRPRNGGSGFRSFLSSRLCPIFTINKTLLVGRPFVSAGHVEEVWTT